MTTEKQSNEVKESKLNDEYSFGDKAKKIYINKLDAIRMTIKQSKKLQKARQQSNQNTGPSNAFPSTNLFIKTVLCASFLSTALLFVTKRYIFTSREFWAQRNYSTRRKTNFYHTHHYCNLNSSIKRSNNDEVIKFNLRMLGLPTSNMNPTSREIKDAFRKTSFKTHPDVVKASNESSKAYFKERFVLAKNAHDFLMARLKR